MISYYKVFLSFVRSYSCYSERYEVTDFLKLSTWNNSQLHAFCFILVAGVVCHYQVGTLFFYDDAYKVQPEQIDVNLCDTLIASHAILDIDTFTIQAYSVEEEGIISDSSHLKFF